ncbi:MAG: ABC transporter permease [bacterium]|nr:ABC transporter permease [bacterium]MCY4273047.1 ABC transporter permease [bacterium]
MSAGVRSLVRHGPVFAERAFKRFIRSPSNVVSTAGFPLLLLLTLLAVFSHAVEGVEDGPYAQRLVPMLVVSGLMFGSVSTAVGFFTDLSQGYMERIRTMPVSAAGPLLGAVLGEIGRAAMALAVLVAVGHGFEFRFDNGIGPAIGFFLVAMLASVSIVWIGLAMAAVARSQEALGPPLGALFLLLLFLSRGMVPVDAYPGWAQPIVRFNPATAYVTAMDRLARGGELVTPILGSLAWSAGIIAAFGWIAVRSVRRPR